MTLNSNEVGIEAINRAPSLSDRAVEVLRERILDGTYGPGRRLVEVELAQAFQISRGPLREALRGLVHEGLVNHVPNKGFYIPDVSVKEALALYELRAALETGAARLAAQRITASELRILEDAVERARDVLGSDTSHGYPHDADFHSAVLKAAHSPSLESRALETNRQIQLLRQRSAYSYERAQAALEEHIAVVEAIAAGDSERAADLMNRHQANSLEHAMATMSASVSNPVTP